MMEMLGIYPIYEHSSISIYNKGVTSRGGKPAATWILETAFAISPTAAFDLVASGMC